MIRRPLNPRFVHAVLDGIKTTTIRAKPWPVGKPIMLFNWSGLPYRSKQVDVAPIIVEEAGPINMTHCSSGMILYWNQDKYLKPWKTEGFQSQDDMDEWFTKLVKPGQTITQHIMRFRVAHELTTTAPISA